MVEGVEGSITCQGRLGMNEMVGFVQRARKKLYGKTLKLGQIGEMLQMSGEILEKWVGASCLMVG